MPTEMAMFNVILADAECFGKKLRLDTDLAGGEIQFYLIARL
jgi:hypothetical protein